jgi:hypothetical protein
MPPNGKLNGHDPHSRDMLAALKQAIRHGVLVMLALPIHGGAFSYQRIVA